MKKQIKVLLAALTACAIIYGFNQRSGASDNQRTADGEMAVGLNIGDQAPELVFKDPDGQDIALSSLRGKMVLIVCCTVGAGEC